MGEKGRAGEVYNIGVLRDAELPNIEVTKVILEHLKLAEDSVEFVSDRPAHDRRYAVDYGKIKAELGWEPRTPFAEGLGRTIAWYRSNRPWWQAVKSGEYLKYYERQYGQR